MRRAAVHAAPNATSNTIRDYTRRIARALKVVGLMNVQYAIKDDVVYVLEVNPRASRTVPYLSKATGVPLAKVAATRDGGEDAGRTRSDEDIDACRGLREEPGVPVRALPWRRHHPRTGDEVHRRGDGRRRQLRRRVRQGDAVRRASGCPRRARCSSSVNNDDKAEPCCRSRAT
ncbi:MAG: ATP-grasp domain-containing protein [Vicinamibacterales bacterium]